MKKPIIAITLDRCEDSEELKYSPRPWYALRADYSALVAKLGGIPILISYEHGLVDDVVAMVDGLIIPGGDLDIPPKFYGQKILSPKVRPNEERARYEIALIKKAVAAKIPFLGICNGVQILNVALGGTLIQDIATQRPSNINHHKLAHANYQYHSIEIAKGTKLYDIAGSQKEWQINSNHHQAVDVLGKGLIASAKAPDGIIEAVEVADHPFAIGVEWHPEYQNSALDENLFMSFMKATCR